MKILFTGATGILGSHILSSLLLNNEIYVLVRDAEKRLDRLAGLGIPPGNVFESDMEKEELGLADNAVARLRSTGLNLILHVAASVKFDEKYRNQTFNINKNGTQRLIDLGKTLNIRNFHFVSTAYAPFQRNPYEISKKAAEELIISSGLSYNIYRLGVVVGERRSCSIKGFNGFYGYVMASYFMAQSIRKGKYSPVELPLKIPCSFTSTINIVPVDWVVSQLVSLINLGTFNEIYHLTNPQPPLSSWLLKVIYDYLHIGGINYVDWESYFKTKTDNGSSTLQKLFDRKTERFLPYLREEKGFDVSSTEKRLSKQYEPPGIVTEEWIHGLLEYAIKNEFGRQTRNSGVNREKFIR